MLVAVAVQSRGRGPAETQTFSFAPKVREIPEQLREVWWVRRLNVLVLGALARARDRWCRSSITAPSRHLLYATIGCFAICALSLTVLTGWAGQLSLGQMAFAGFGALLAAALTPRPALDLGRRSPSTSPVCRSLLSIVLAAFAHRRAGGAHRRRRAAGARAAARGQHVRVRVAAQQYLYRQPVLSDDADRSVPFPRGTLFGLDLSSQRTYYYVVSRRPRSRRWRS